MNGATTADVAVIGAGISGLATAHFLAGKGLDPHLIEKQDRAGGTIRTTRTSGFLVEHGPNSVQDTTPLWRELCGDLGEIMGIRNLFRACVIDSTPEGLLLDWDGLELLAPDQNAATEDEVTVYIRPEDIKVIYPDRPMMDAVSHNQVQGRIQARYRHADLQTLRVCLPNDHEVEVCFPGYAYARLSLDQGDDLCLSLRRDSLVVLQPPGEQNES